MDTRIYSKESRQTKRHIHTCMFCGQSGTELSNEQHHSLLAERERLRAGLELAAKRIDFLTNWIENSYSGVNKDVKLGRAYASEARAVLNDQKGVASADQKGGEG